MCLGYGYECLYRSTPRSRRRQRGSSRLQTIGTQEGSPSVAARTASPQQEQYTQISEPPQELQPQGQQVQEQQGLPYYLRSVQSNSGAAFVRLLTTTLESNQNPSPVRMLAWNLFLGERRKPDIFGVCLTDVLKEIEMQDLAAVYFAKFHPCYAFVNLGTVARDISDTWNYHGRSDAREAMLCGVAAIGSLFSTTQNLRTESALVAIAKRLLDPSTAGPPSLHLSAAWLLRTVYLRLTAKPEEAWLASCTTLHMIDAAGSMSRVGLDTSPVLDGSSDVSDIRKSLIGVAQHLNIWLSFDLGRRRVVLPSLTALPLASKPGEYTTELLGLLPYSEVLDPANELSSETLLKMLEDVLDRTHNEPPSVLAQCNLTLCIYRRLHPSSLAIPDCIKINVFRLMQKSLLAVLSALDQGLPWHHVANIPFQVLCLLLFIDTAQSFALLSDALSCIVAVNNAYQTEATREAETAAYTLVQLHRERREEELRSHANMLELYPLLSPQVQESQSHLLSGDALQDSWWLNHFMPLAQCSVDVADFL
ncbi:hypothetical protein OPT61_g3269 [Boeremia exigua]|uniref:Uncharacterized protein n=1 Tax=Boeremia exigua TaxID=749465 RepID=A0ACC2IIJ0_9PLEO|nr:hypothetical protein OPT61_g3269 [Boeremia exigua]